MVQMDKDHGDDVLLACTIGDISWLKRGLLHGSNPRTKNEEGLNGLHLAAKNGRLACLKYMLENCGVEINDPSASTGNTALHYSVSNKNDSTSYHCMKLLLENGADHTLQNKLGHTALHLAACCGKIGCLKALLKHGSNIHTVDNEGQTAHKLACLYGHHGCARVLQSLHWANDKNVAANSRIEQETTCKQQEEEHRAIQAQMRREAAALAYSEWLDKKNVTQSQQNHKQTHSESKILIREHQRTKTFCPIEINPRQSKQNLSSFKRLDKQPTKQKESSSNQMSKSGSVALSSGRSSRNSKAQSHSTGRKCFHIVSKKQTPKLKKQLLQVSVKLKSSNSTVLEELSHSKDQSRNQSCFEMAKEAYVGELNVTKLVQDGTINKEECKSTFTFENDNDESDEVDSLFHDVGHVNSLDALALPTALTKGRTYAQILQLVRTQGGSQPYKRSFSFSHGRTHAHFVQHERRFSLGSIPEGEIVTNYEDDLASSQEIDEHFLQSLMLGNDISSGGNGLETKIAWQDHNTLENTEEQVERVCGAYSSEDKESCPSFEGINTTTPVCNQLVNHVNSEAGESVVPESVLVSGQHALPSCSLKIVNLAWDPVSNSVRSDITESPLSPLSHERSGRLTPPKRIPSPFFQHSNASVDRYDVLNYSGQNLRHSLSTDSKFGVESGVINQSSVGTPTSSNSIGTSRCPVIPLSGVNKRFSSAVQGVQSNENPLSSRSMVISRIGPHSNTSVASKRNTLLHTRVKSAPNLS